MAGDKLTYVSVGTNGTFRKMGATSTTPEEIDALFEHLRANSISKLAIHFHGGLVSEEAGMEIARDMRRVYESAQCHPVTFVWKTSVAETVLPNLGKVFDSKLFQKLLIWALKKAVEHLGISDAKGSAVWSHQDIEAELAKDEPFADVQFEAGARGGAARLSEADLPNVEVEILAELVEDIEGDTELFDLLETPTANVGAEAARRLSPDKSDGAKGITLSAKVAFALAKIAVRVVARFVRETEHGLYPTTVEEILREYYMADLGAQVWSLMKSTANAMWKPNDGLEGDQRNVGAYFLGKLADAQSSTPLTVDLVGHSLGSIAICHLLDAAATMPSIKIRNVLLLAPAATSSLFDQSIAAQPGRYKSVRIFTMHDRYERSDQLVKKLYTRSLLYFISGVLEEEPDTPIIGMHRYLTEGPPYDDALLKKVRAYVLDAGKSRLVLSSTTALTPSAAFGFKSDSQTHQGFDNDPMTRESLTRILAA